MTIIDAELFFRIWSKTITLNAPAGGIILSENGAVLSAHNDTLSAAQASLAVRPLAGT